MPSCIQRGAFNFLVNETGNLIDCPENIDALKRLWLDRTLISRSNLGPGVREGEAWHISCHLVAAGCVKRSRNGQLLWLEISHDGESDRYYASVTTSENGNINTMQIDSSQGNELVEGSTLLGFVEGTSVGRISAKGIDDSPESFNGYMRQRYDSTPGSTSQGGKTWEHWCTTRNFSASSDVGSSVLSAYIKLTAVSGDLFPATVARGRTQFGHPRQLDAMIVAGFTTEESASWQTEPVPIPRDIELRLQKATPADAFGAIELLEWNDIEPRYYMFERKIRNWGRRE